MNEPKIETPAVETPVVPANEPVEKPTLLNKVMNILQANTLIQSITNDNKSLLSRLQEKETEVANLHKMSEEWATKVAGIEQLETSHKSQLSIQKAEYDKQINDLKANITAAETSAGSKAVKILANVGIPVEDLPKVATVTKIISPEEIVEQFNKLKGPEQTAFYNEHRPIILKATGMVK